MFALWQSSNWLSVQILRSTPEKLFLVEYHTIHSGSIQLDLCWIQNADTKQLLDDEIFNRSCGWRIYTLFNLVLLSWCWLSGCLYYISIYPNETLKALLNGLNTVSFFVRNQRTDQSKTVPRKKSIGGQILEYGFRPLIMGVTSLWDSHQLNELLLKWLKVRLSEFQAWKSLKIRVLHGF